MNIFVTNRSALICANDLDDKRVVKMVLETCQLLNNASSILYKIEGGVIPYKLTHMKHPCTLWAAKSEDNFLWLTDYFAYLLEEYTSRYHKEHKCEQYLSVFQNLISEDWFKAPLEFLNCTTRHKHIDDVFEAYKAELNLKWDNDVRPATWCRGACMPPKWRIA